MPPRARVPRGKREICARHGAWARCERGRAVDRASDGCGRASSEEGGGKGARAARMARSNASYLDDLLAGRMNIMDEKAAKGSRSMARMGGMTSGGGSSASASAARVGGGDKGWGGAGGPARASGPASASGEDLDAFFDAHRSTRVSARGSEARAASRSSDGFEDIGLVGGSTPSAGSRDASAASGDLDAFFAGFGASGDRSPIGSQSVPAKAPVSKTTVTHARAASGGADAFDFFGGGAREAPKPLIRHERDDSLIDGLDEILGEVSIASSPVKTRSSDKAESIPSSLSRSASQTLNDLDDLFSSSGEPEAPVGLARFRAPASSSASQNPPSAPASKTRDAAEDAPRGKPTPAPKVNPKSFETTAAPASAPPATSKLRTASSTASSVEDLDDFFSAGAAKASAPPSSKSAVDSLEAMFTVPSSGVAMSTSGVVDDLFGAMDVRAMAHQSGTTSSFEYAPEEEIDPNEPPERAALRAARHERNRQRIEQALKEKRARESAARQEQAERQMLKDLIGADIDAWQKKNQNNIRTMLANLGDVLWEGHRYKAPDMATLMQPIGVKKSYHKALVIIHPDKVSQSGGDMSQRYIADKVFDIMKVAYKDFEAKELSG